MHREFPDLLAHFEAGQAEPAQFHHRQHVRVSYELLERHPFPEALLHLARGLRTTPAFLFKPPFPPLGAAAFLFHPGWEMFWATPIFFKRLFEFFFGPGFQPPPAPLLPPGAFVRGGLPPGGRGGEEGGVGESSRRSAKFPIIPTLTR